MGIATRLLGKVCGVEVAGIDLLRPRQADIASLIELLDAHKVVVVRDVHLTPEDHLELALRFGTLQLHPYLTDNRSEHPHILVMEGTRALAHTFHSDETFLARPPATCLLRIEAVPSSGGGTSWINLEAVYDSLSRVDQRRLADAVATHETLDGDCATSHPAVRAHPRTGRPALFINRLFTKSLGLQAGPDDGFLTRLLDCSEDSAYGCSTEWSAGDLAIWDNCCTLHRANNDFDTYRRVERIAVAGDRPARYDR